MTSKTRTGRRAAAIALVAGMGLAMLAAAFAAPGEGPALPYRAYMPQVSQAELPPLPIATPTPVPRPETPDGRVTALYLGSAGILGSAPIEARGTHYVGGRELFEDPSAPQYISTYPQWGTGRPGRTAPGAGGMNTIFAAHVNYVNYGNGPFAYLHQAAVGDALYVTLDNGTQLAYTVAAVEIVPVASLNMDRIVFPTLDGTTERVTLISCGGTFVPAAVGGEYTSRVILIAERYVP
ncbi:MAG: class F sortase [Dehalococcoidia bacterium]